MVLIAVRHGLARMLFFFPIVQGKDLAALLPCGGVLGLQRHDGLRLQVLRASISMVAW